MTKHIWELAVCLGNGTAGRRVADLRSGIKWTGLPLGSPGESHLFQSGVLMVILGPPLVQAEAPSGRSGDSVLVFVPHRRVTFNKGPSASESLMVFASFGVQIVVKTTVFASLDPQIIAKTTVFATLDPQIIVKTIVFASLDPQIVAKTMVFAPLDLQIIVKTTVFASPGSKIIVKTTVFASLVAESL